MSLRIIQNTWTGLITGIIVTVAILALQLGGVLPLSVTGYLLLFAGGLTAGLFTKGTVMEGALTGLAIGSLIVAGLVGWTMSMWNGARGILPILSIPGAFAIMSAIFVPANTVSGIIGTVIRKWYLKEPFFKEFPEDPS